MCGIGGRTIAEAKQNLEYSEFCDWLRYRNKRGTLNAGFRTELGTGQIATLIANALGGKGKSSMLQDFAPHVDEPELTIESAERMINGI